MLHSSADDYEWSLIRQQREYSKCKVPNSGAFCQELTEKHFQLASKTHPASTGTVPSKECAGLLLHIFCRILAVRVLDQLLVSTSDPPAK